MANTLEALRVLQWGKEATKGTGVPATSKIAVPARNLTFDESGSIYRPQLAKGVLIRNRGNETPVMHGTTWQLADSPWLYEQGANWLSMSVGSSGNSASGLSPYTYAYTRSLTADPAPTAWTIEERLSDGSNNRDVEYNYALAESLGFKYAEGGPLMFNAKGFARRVQSSTLTAAQTMPSPEIAPSALLTAFIDSAFGSIGGTQLTAQVIGMEFEFGTGFKPQMTADGRTDLDFTTHILDPDAVTMSLKLTCLLTTARLSTERTAAAAGTMRAVRLAIAGTGSRSLTLDMLLKHTKPEILQIGQQNGQDIVVMEMEDSSDGSNPSFTATLINTIASIV
jgi:hypothetical protein